MGLTWYSGAQEAGIYLNKNILYKIMKKKVIVISLGGSMIIPEKMDFKFLDKFRKTLRAHYKDWKFVVVCGGGTIARKYISALKREGKSKKELSMAGIMATRTNARFMIQYFGKEDANDNLPMSMREIEEDLKKNSVVFCGALRFVPNSTSDGTAAMIAHYFKSNFINITNVKGLYTDNPFTNKNAKFIAREGWKEFERRALKLSFHAGQHFVLDQEAAVIIREHKIPTYIINKPENISKILRGKRFVGTRIAG